jgi:hypothetical protein
MACGCPLKVDEWVRKILKAAYNVSEEMFLVIANFLQIGAGCSQIIQKIATSETGCCDRIDPEGSSCV